jgi:hypothetical protein
MSVNSIVTVPVGMTRSLLTLASIDAPAANCERGRRSLDVGEHERDHTVRLFDEQAGIFAASVNS